MTPTTTRRSRTRATKRAGRILRTLGWLAVAAAAWFVTYALLVLAGR